MGISNVTIVALVDASDPTATIEDRASRSAPRRWRRLDRRHGASLLACQEIGRKPEVAGTI
jgi:hypothetical protein